MNGIGVEFQSVQKVLRQQISCDWPKDGAGKINKGCSTGGFSEMK